jgi:2-oxoisovalerate dehydrogenase E2 component (dihydrolipoyl transacylase)
MTRYVFKMPDLGEGTVEAEVVAWHVQVGDTVAEDQIMAEVMTDKAAVEVPSPVSGRVVALNGQPGDMVRVGSEFVVFETEVSDTSPTSVGEVALSAGEGRKPSPQPSPAAAGEGARAIRVGEVLRNPVEPSGRIKASPATRRRAREAGLDLRSVHGSGPSGRITRQDIEAAVSGAGEHAVPSGSSAIAGLAPRTGVLEIKVIGVRRLIAQRMTEAKRNIPHFSYVEEVDVTELESLRSHLNAKLPKGSPSLTYLPFLATALVRVLDDFPQCNALYDAERGVLMRHEGVHLGVATQTPDGLKVPVVRHAEARALWDLSDEIRRVSETARAGKASSKDLTGSTITITSLGKLGGIVSTPIINAPEMAIIGVNKAIDRPVVLNGAITVRRMMNLSSSFDHRFVDGYDAAAMIQALKDLLEHPATIFIPG